ncbi:MAG: hypothetical protein AAGE84_17100 [Cyanobacteria bacterium P01_G01_bin.39]
MVDKPITRAERQAKIKANAEKLNNHINSGVKDFVRDIKQEYKEARKNARWYETGEALKEAKLEADYEADREFLAELEGSMENYYDEMNAELEESETRLLMAEDDVIDVEFKPLPSFKNRTRRTSKLSGSSNNLRRLGSSKEVALPKVIESKNNPFASKKKPFA